MLLFTYEYHSQIEEKLWAQRRKSNEAPHPLGLHFTSVNEEDTITVPQVVPHTSPLVRPRPLAQADDKFAVDHPDENDGIGNQAATSSGCECRVPVAFIYESNSRFLCHDRHDHGC